MQDINRRNDAENSSTFRLQSFTYNSNRVKARTIRVHVVAEKNDRKNMFSQ